MLMPMGVIRCEHLPVMLVAKRPAANMDEMAAHDSARIGQQDIEAAAQRIAGDVRRTPLWRLPGRALGLPAAEVWLKLEHLQVGGSFKARGMFNRLRAQASLPAAGVVVASGGNAGIAVAHAARALNQPCTVFVPEVSSPAKRAVLAGLGAQVVVQGSAYADALVAAQAHRQSTGALWMHAYDQAEVVAGAGTLALEVEREAGLPDRALVSVGGGGLIAGIAAWFAGRCRVEALETEGTPTLHAALRQGEPVDVSVSGVAADALGARRIGQLCWAGRAHIAASHLLSDEAVARAQAWLWQELRLALEPAAALPLAALQSGVLRPQAHERVLLVLCGGNVAQLPAS
jgi:threonine dehydratase